jgi:hypothetical protein
VDKLFSWSFVLGACAIAYVYGAVSWYYRLPPSDFIDEGFIALDTWRATLRDAAKREANAHASAKSAEDEPTQEAALGKTTWNKQRAYNGYTLFTHRFSTDVHLLDMSGNIAWRWSLPFEKTWPKPGHINQAVHANIFTETAHVFPNGDLLVQYCGVGDTPYGYGLAKFDKHGKVLWTYNENAHHDFHVDKEGYIYALVQKMLKTPPPSLKGLPSPILADYIVKLSPGGKEMERISILEAFQNSEFALMLFNKNNRYKIVDWDQFHTNTIRKLEPEIAGKFPMFKAGQLLISSRSMNMLAVIDPTERKVVWAYKGHWQWQHAARFLPNGNILVLDNRGHHVQGHDYSKIVEFDPKTLETKWEFSGGPDRPLRTVIYGRAQRLPNGNTLVAFSYDRRILEITPSREIVWSFDATQPFEKNRFQYITTAERYAKDALPFLNE